MKQLTSPHDASSAYPQHYIDQVSLFVIDDIEHRMPSDGHSIVYGDKHFGLLGDYFAEVGGVVRVDSVLAVRVRGLEKGLSLRL